MSSYQVSSEIYDGFFYPGITLNSAARKFDHITPLLIELHWLPVEQRKIFKILLFTFKVVNGLAPSYLSELLETYVPRRMLRSSTQLLLHEPKFNLKT